MNNTLVKAENMRGLNYLLNEGNLHGKVDLVYIDPPFSTGGNFTISDDRVATISSARKGALAFSDKIHGKDFLEYLRVRLLLLRELMSERGSIYLHIDYKIGHYVKILMDEVFGIANFRNDITRIKCNPKNFNRIGYGNIKDLILFYSRSKKPIWNEPREEYTDADLKKLFSKTDKHGRHYTTIPLHAPGETVRGKSAKPFRGKLPPQGRHWRTDVETLERWDHEGLIEWSARDNPRKIVYADERDGKRVQDVWHFKDPQYPTYPTEKNAALLDRIVRTSSNRESLILDCFCGSGTTLASAQVLGRKWIGIDQSEPAIRAARKKLANIMLPMEDGYDFIDLEAAEAPCR